MKILFLLFIYCVVACIIEEVEFNPDAERTHEDVAFLHFYFDHCTCKFIAIMGNIRLDGAHIVQTGTYWPEERYRKDKNAFHLGFELSWSNNIKMENICASNASFIKELITYHIGPTKTISVD